MQRNETSMSVAELQKMIHIWKSRYITDSNISKLLELYLGLTPYMNSQRIYPQENFYEIKNSLKFTNTQTLVEAMKRSQSFPFITDPATGAVQAFWSPLYHESNAETQAEPYNNNYYSLLPEDRTSLGSSSPKDNSPKDNNATPSEENIPLPENSEATADALTAAAQEFFHRINANEEEKTRILVPLIEYFQQQEGIDRPQACQALVCLVNEQLIPYFARLPKFMKINHAGRLSWLCNLLKSAHGTRLKNEAARTSRTKRERTAREDCRKQCSELRSFHPVSPHEWSDRESGLRFYDDATEGTILIPIEAEPRPTDTAQWNVLSKEWCHSDHSI